MPRLGRMPAPESVDREQYYCKPSSVKQQPFLCHSFSWRAVQAQLSCSKIKESAGLTEEGPVPVLMWLWAFSSRRSVRLWTSSLPSPHGHLLPQSWEEDSVRALCDMTTYILSPLPYSTG